MAQNQMQGLFTGPGVNDVYARQRQERDQKVRQAMADSAGAGGNFYANLQAKANEQMSQAFQGGVRGLLQGTDLAPAEDPRLAKARTRDKDKGEIMGILGGFSDPKSPGGKKITQQEMEIGFSELMSRGYPQEAASFLQQAQSMQKLDIDAVQASANLVKAQNANKGESGYTWGKSDKVKAADGTVFIRTEKRPKGKGDVTFQFFETNGKPVSAPDSAVETLGDMDQTDEEIHADRLDRISSIGVRQKNVGTHNEMLKRGTVRYKELLSRKTDELKSSLNITEHKAKKMAEATMVTRATSIENGTTARRGKPALKALLELAKARNKGGDASAAFAAFKRVFGMENQSDAEFRTGAQLIMVKNLKRLFGPRATDKDMEELKKAFMGEGQTQEANLAIINRFLGDYQFEIDQADYFYDKPDADGGAYYNHLRSQQEALESATVDGSVVVNGTQYTVERVQ